jgi:hypothetical protein
MTSTEVPITTLLASAGITSWEEFNNVKREKGSLTSWQYTFGDYTINDD